MNELDLQTALPPWNWVDITALVILLLGMLAGLRRGLSRELAGGISAVIAAFVGWRFYQPLGEHIYRVTRLEQRPAHALGFLVAVLGAFLVLLAVRLVLTHIMEFTFKGKIERIGGMLFGFLRAAVITGAVIFFIGLWPHEYLHRMFAEESATGRMLQAWVPPAYEDLSEQYPGLPRLKARETQEEESLGPEDETY
jgi:membrane protein required for colicin V production